MVPLDLFTRLAAHRGHRVKVSLDDAQTTAFVECVACCELLVEAPQTKEADNEHGG